MKPIVNRLTDAVEKRVRFNRTYNELRRMDRRTGWDLDMFPEDALKIAYAHVYGR